MADAKITIQTLVDNKELQELNKEFAEGSQKLKKLQGDLKQAEKQFGVASDEAKKLRAELEMQRTVNRTLLKDMTKTTRELTNQAKAFDGASQGASKFSQMAKGIGIDLDGIMGKLTSTTGLIAGLATAVTVAGTALVNSAREVSALSNQFISFAGNAKDAQKMYSLFNDTYRNTNYGEQQVMDMAKGLMRIGINAKESAKLIELCADASAGLGHGAEFADQLAQTLAKVKTGGQVTEKQLQQLAQAGIDLTDVQEDIKAGGERAYEALKKKLGEFEGSMNKAKQTAEEMEGDIKGNCIQIGRELALLIDDVFGFSDMLRSFYQWIIDVSQTVINKIREMRSAFAQSVASANAYAQAMEGVEDPGEFGDGADYEAYAAKQQAAYAAAEAAKAEAKAREESVAALEKETAQIKSIAGSAVSHGGTSGSARSSSASTAKEEDPFQTMMKQHQFEMDAIKAELDFKLASRLIDQESYDAMMEERRVMNDEWVEKQLQDEQLTLEQKVALWKQYMAKTQEVQKEQQKTVNQYWDGMAHNFASAMADCIMGAKSFGEAFKGIIKQIIAQLMQAAIYAAIVAAFTGGSTSFGSAFKGAMGFSGKKAEGGYISGPGTGTSDSAGLYALSNGEYVLNARAVEMVGVDNLNRINGAGRMASGGPVAGGSVGTNITLYVSAMDASGFGEFLSHGGFDAIKDAFSNDDRMLGTLAGA